MSYYTYRRFGPRLSPERMAELYADGKTLFDIGLLAGCTGPTVRAHLVAQGIEIRPPWRAGRAQPRKKLKLTDAEIIAEYQAGRTMDEVAYLADCSSHTVCRILDKAGIERRKFADYRKARGPLQSHRAIGRC